MAPARAAAGPSVETRGGDVLVLVVEVLAGVGVLFAVALLVTGRAGAMTGTAPDRAPVELPEGRALTGADLSRVRFGVAVRGYRMGDVDAVLDRLVTEIDARDARLAALEGRSGGSGADVTPDGGDARAGERNADEPWFGDDGRAASEVPAPPAVPPLPGPGGPATGPLTVAPAAWEDPYAPVPGADAESWAAEDTQAPVAEDTGAEDTGAADDEPGWWADVGAASEDHDQDGPIDEPTDEWRALYDELRPAEPAPQERGDGPRRITGPWGRTSAEPDDEGGPWPSSW